MRRIDWRDKALEMVEEGRLDRDELIMGCLKYMSQDQVEDMMFLNEFVSNDDEEEDDEG